MESSKKQRAVALVIYNERGKKRYLAYQRTDDFDGNEDILSSYFLTDRDTYMLNLPNHSAEHPTHFKTEKEAYAFIADLRHKGIAKHAAMSIPKYSSFSIEVVFIPPCDMNCWKCNKKDKYHCKHLVHPYQNICGFKMASLPDNYVKDEKRIDAPCELCRTIGCRYCMNYL